MQLLLSCGLASFWTLILVHSCRDGSRKGIIYILPYKEKKQYPGTRFEQQGRQAESTASLPHWPRQPQVGHSHIDAGVPACKGGPARVHVHAVEMLTGILLLYLHFSGEKKKKILFHSFFLSCLVKKIAEYTYKTNCVVFWKKTCIAIDFASSNRDRLPGILPCGPKRRGVGREMGRGRVTAVQGWVQLLLQVYHRDTVWVETSGTASV